jgi:hypothetical protein
MKDVTAFAPYCAAVGNEEQQVKALCTHSGGNHRPVPCMQGSSLRRGRDRYHKHHLRHLPHRDPCFLCPIAIGR